MCNVDGERKIYDDNDGVRSVAPVKHGEFTKEVYRQCQLKVYPVYARTVTPKTQG